MKKIIFRADGNAEIGAGHVMRCLSIGAAARNAGMECVYIVADSSFESIIQSKGFSCRVLDTLYSDMDSELPVFEETLSQYKPDIIIVDSYYVTANYLKELRRFGKTIYIDDVLAFAYPVDILINYNIYADRAEYESLYSDNNICIPELLLGTKYIPLRDEFRLSTVPVQKGNVENILISAGGADPEGMALKLAKCFIEDHELAGKYKFHFIISSFEPNRKELKEIAVQYPWIKLHENVQHMSGLMLESDLAVSAAGSTLYELAACGVPVITYVLADNQLPGALGFEKAGIMVNAGDCRIKTDFFPALCQEIKLLCADKIKRKNMRINGRNTVDGRGAEQMIKDIMRNEV